MKFKTLVLSGLALAFSLVDCTTKEEAVTPAPVVDNGSYIVVYRKSTSGGSAINVDIAGTNIGSITSINGSDPDCTATANGYVKYKIALGTYNVRAVGADGQIWNGTALYGVPQ